MVDVFLTEDFFSIDGVCFVCEDFAAVDCAEGLTCSVEAVDTLFWEGALGAGTGGFGIFFALDCCFAHRNIFSSRFISSVADIRGSNWFVINLLEQYDKTDVKISKSSFDKTGSRN